MAQPVHALKPGQIRCNFDKTVSGLPCMRGRYLDKQCTQKQHLRPWSEIEEIAVKHCELTGETLPDAFVDRKAEREANLQLWFVQYKLLGCRFGRATEAARQAGVEEDKSRLFAEGALKHFAAEIAQWRKDYGLQADEAMAIASSMARGETPTKRVIEDGVETETYDQLGALNSAIDVLGLKKQTINLTNVSDAQLAAELAVIQDKLNAGITDAS